jgi:DNA-binding NarL/FixJ family response regulator
MTAERKKILCIEEDRKLAALFAEQLTDRGFNVDVARDGHEGLVAILKDKPDVVICGICTPTMRGLDVLARANDIAPHVGPVPFIVLAEPADHDDKQKLRKLAGEDQIADPFDFDALAKVIKSRLALAARSKLNEREIQALTWVARGRTSAEIAQTLGMVKRTVDFHIDNARMKLGATTRTAAVSKAVAAGLIEP